MPRYIDADALRKEFSERPPDYYSTDYILDTIDELPALSSDEVRGVGKWITTRTWEHDGDPYCSNCGFEQPYMRFEKFKFCPSCGAKMEVSEDG